MCRKIDAICELLLGVMVGIVAICGAYWIELSILSSDMQFLILKAIGFILPFTFLAILSTRAGVWSFRKQVIAAVVFSLIILIVTAATIMVFVNDKIPNRYECAIAVVVYAVLWSIDNIAFVSYVLNIKQTSAKYSCRNKVLACLENNRERHARLAAGNFVRDEEDFLADTHLADADLDVAIAALESPAFASWISKRYNNDHRAVLNSISKNGAALSPDKPPNDEPDKTEP